MGDNITLIDGLGKEEQIHFGFTPQILTLGCIYFFLKKDIKWFLLELLIGIPTIGLSRIVLSVIYGRLHTKELIKKGFLPKTKEELECLLEAKLISTFHYALVRKSINYSKHNYNI